MNDAECEAQKERPRILADPWIKPLGLGWWEITQEYARDESKPPREPGERSTSIANCEADWRSAHATIPGRSEAA